VLSEWEFVKRGWIDKLHCSYVIFRSPDIFFSSQPTVPNLPCTDTADAPIPDGLLGDLETESTADAHMERRGALVPPKMDYDDDPGGGGEESARNGAGRLSPLSGNHSSSDGGCCSGAGGTGGALKQKKNGRREAVRRRRWAEDSFKCENNLLDRLVDQYKDAFMCVQGLGLHGASWHFWLSSKILDLRTSIPIYLCLFRKS
jgi:hypothetical protein